MDCLVVVHGEEWVEDSTSVQYDGPPTALDQELAQKKDGEAIQKIQADQQAAIDKLRKDSENLKAELAMESRHGSASKNLNRSVRQPEYGSGAPLAYYLR